MTGPGQKTGRREALEAELARQRPRLRLHCYRMVGNLDDADDLTQETALRAWRGWQTYRGNSSLTTWLYQIASHACLDHLRRRARERRPHVPASDFPSVPAQVAVPWLQPYTDEAVGLAAGTAEWAPGPEDRTLARETVRLTFVAAVQFLPPRQRVALLLRDGLDWPVHRCAETLETSPAAVNSAVQRAHARMRDVLGVDPDRWDAGERAGPLVGEYIAAIESADDARIARLLHTEVQVSHAPWAGGNMTDDVVWYGGVDTVLDGWAPILHTDDAPEMILRPVALNGDVGIASWIRGRGAREWETFSLNALRVRDGRVLEISTFGAELFARLGLPTIPPKRGGARPHVPVSVRAPCCRGLE